MSSLKGHRLDIAYSTESVRAERSHTGRCCCGRWQESASTVAGVREEYRYHLARKHRALAHQAGPAGLIPAGAKTRL